ncbi:MAG TPA: response regulator, partial [Thermodesulfovibrionales bacterium]|nr:response regulator [Thermodesulfovibrionales bacterium]
MISVLFVDDNSDLFGQIRSFLEKAGDIRLDNAHSIKQAIEKTKGRTYDVIVCYEQIPEVNGIEFVSDMTGIEFLKYLKSQGNSTPVILLCRRGNNKIAVQEVSIGTDIRLPKNGDIRPHLLEIVTLIKQTMLRRKAER